MLILNSQLENVAVMSLQSGTSLGSTTDPIIDPRKLQIVAYYMVGPRIHEVSVLHTSDIREFGPLGFIVDSTDSIMELDEDLIRLREVIDLRFTLLGKTVVDDRKKRLGKVNEYTIESESFTIQKIHVAQSIMKNIASSNLIIHRSQIVEITDHFIVVRSGSVQHQVGLTQALNPFRKSAPGLAPDSAKASRSMK